MRYLFMGLIIGLIVVFLTGCGTMRDLVVEKVNIPVIVPCHIVPPEKPMLPLQQMEKTEPDIFVVMQKALSEIEFRAAYEVKLEAAIESCNK